MAADSPRILELRRRVYNDPSSIAFAQLGEELRRAGAYEEAVDVCQAGLTRHAGYLSARVTLGRALIELDRLDDAERELRIVVERAPDNLAAIRGLAEIHQRRGAMVDALDFYRRALELARHDPDLEETVERMEKEVAPQAAPEPEVSVEELFDFDRLVEQLGAETPPQVAALDRHRLKMPVSASAATSAPEEAPGVIAAASPSDDDPLAALEVSLRVRPLAIVPRPEESSETDQKKQENSGMDVRPIPAAAETNEAQALGELERWLEALRTSA